MRKIRIFALLIVAFVIMSASLTAQNLKSDEIISKHLDAIGKKETRDTLNTLMAVGYSQFESKLPTVKGVGKAVVTSDSRNLMFLMSLNSKEYPFEKVGYFSDKINLPYTTAGARSPLGAFIAEHAKILSEGLFTGSMSLRWALLDADRKGASTTARGTKKINGRKAYVLEYFPSNGGSSEFSIRLYFDTETFNHVRSEYIHEINPKEDTFGTLGRQGGTRLILTEDFSDFKTVDGFTFPYSYKVDFSTSSNQGLFEYTWSIKVTQYYLNQKLAPEFFTFETK
ncbi:MAG: hypothetical protein ABIO36_00225 [Pyrinomonadaceae bacterium]